jgi:type IV pilus assembly protein PilN
MIHINLLPVKKTSAGGAGQQQAIIMAAILLVTLLINFWGYRSKANQEDDLARKITKTENDLKELDKVIGEVKDINQRKEDLKKKLAVLDSLKANRSGPVKVLDAMQSSLPKKVWLGAISEKGGAMQVDGSAFSHDDLAEFMSGLENVVDTPKGIGKVVEQGNSGKPTRVELADGNVADFPNPAVKHFFTNIQLKGATEKPQANFKIVSFQLTCSANYSA